MAKTVRTNKKKEVSLDALGLEAGKVPPQAIDVEEAVLGAMMIEPNCVPDVLERLIADCFYKEANRKIFSAISALSKDHEPVDIFTVAEASSELGTLRRWEDRTISVCSPPRWERPLMSTTMSIYCSRNTYKGS